MNIFIDDTHPNIYFNVWKQKNYLTNLPNITPDI